MANPLVKQYQALATDLDPLIQLLEASGQHDQAQEVGAAQNTLRAACVTMIAIDIDDLLDPTDHAMAKAISAISSASEALNAGAAAILKDVSNVTRIVNIASSAAQIASSLAPLNISGLIAGASDTAKQFK